VQLPVPSLFDTSTLSFVTSGSESLFVGTQDGQIHIVSSTFKPIRSFAAYEPGSGSVTHIKQIDGTALLVTIAEDLSREPRLKVWALDKIEKKTGIPKCLSSIEIQNNRKQFPISAFAALEDLSQLAVGFANGAVTVVRGDLIHDRGTKQRTVFESEEPITGLEFREGANTVLYVATTGRILTLTISGRGQGQPARPLEDMGCAVNCMTIDKESQEIVVVRDDRIYYYGVNGRGPSYAYEGPKKLVKTFQHYVTIVSPPQASNKRFFDTFNTSRFSILDLDLQYVAHTESLTSEVHTAFSEWGDLFLLTRDGKVRVCRCKAQLTR
jgi:vacuolar protein sorting-associated protein 11